MLLSRVCGFCSELYFVNLCRILNLLNVFGFLSLHVRGGNFYGLLVGCSIECFII